jgi:flagellar basal body-associated protein FliL
MAEKKRKTELDIEGIAPPPKVEEPPPPPPPPQSEVVPDEHEDVTAHKASPADKKKKVIIVSVVASLVLIIGISFAIKSKAPAKKKEKPVHVEEKEESPPSPPPSKEQQVKSPKVYNLTLEPFILPIHGKNGDRLIRLGLAIQVSNEDALDEAKENITLIRKSVLFYLNTKDKRDLLDDKSRIKMMEDIKSNVDRSLQSGRALAVLVDEFVVY